MEDMKVGQPAPGGHLPDVLLHTLCVHRGCHPLDKHISPPPEAPSQDGQMQVCVRVRRPLLSQSGWGL